MSLLQNFVDKQGPVVSAAWLNLVDVLKSTIFENAVTKLLARTALTSDAPMEVANGGTGTRGPGVPATWLAWLTSFFPAIWQLINPTTESEIAAAKLPADFSFSAGKVRRHGSAVDISTAIQDALLANAGQAIYLPTDKIYTINRTTPIIVPANTDIRTEGGGRVILDASGSTLSGLGLFVCQGSLGASLGGGLASAISIGDITIPFNSAPAVVPGDQLHITNLADSSWNGDRVAYRQGEYRFVKSVAGAVVTLEDALRDSYVDTCVVYKVDPTTTQFDGDIQLLGNPADTANLAMIYFQHAKRPKVIGLSIINPVSSGIVFSSCYAPLIDAVEIRKDLTDAGAIQSSGIIFSGVQGGTARDGQSHVDRHAMSMGGGGMLVDRDNTVIRYDLASRTAAAADFHGNVEGCTYECCSIDGGVNLSGARNNLIRNKIFPHATVTALINFDAARATAQNIDGNEFYLRGAVVQYVLDANASTDINANTIEGGPLSFSRNKFFDDTAGNRSYIFFRNNGSPAADIEVHLTDNIFKKTNTAFYGNVLSCSVVSGSDFYRLVWEKNELTKCGFGITTGFGRMLVNGDTGFGTSASTSPSFGAPFFEPSEFWFEKVINVATPATKYTIISANAVSTLVPVTISGVCNVDITATSTNFLSVGNDNTNRRADFGTFASAAAASKHAKQSKMLWMGSSELTNQVIAPGEVLSLMSVDVATDGAVLASNIGGASQTINLRVKVRMNGHLPDAP